MPIKQEKNAASVRIPYPSITVFCYQLYFAQVCQKPRQSRSSDSSGEDYSDGGMIVMILIIIILIITITADVMTPVPQKNTYVNTKKK